MTHGKFQILKQALRIEKGTAKLPLVASELYKPRSLTLEAAARGPLWLCALSPAVLHSCTP